MSEWDKYMGGLGGGMGGWVPRQSREQYDADTQKLYGDTYWWQGPGNQRRRIEDASVQGWLTGADQFTKRKGRRWDKDYNPYTDGDVRTDRQWRVQPHEQGLLDRERALMEAQGQQVYTAPLQRTPEQIAMGEGNIGNWFDGTSRQMDIRNQREASMAGGLRTAGINAEDYTPTLNLYEDLNTWNPFYDKSRGGYLQNNAYDYLADALDKRKMVKHRKEIVKRVQSTPGISQRTAMTPEMFDKLGLSDFGLEFNADFNPNWERASYNPARPTAGEINEERRGFLGAYNAKKAELANKPSVMSLFKEMEEF